MSLEELQVLSMASTTTKWAREGHTFVKAGVLPYAGDTKTQQLSTEYLGAAAAAGVYVLLDMSADGLALAIAGQPRGHNVSTPRNITQFAEW